jgi:ADP-ribosyl-[dinitrogen reductase] hydrolase
MATHYIDKIDRFRGALLGLAAGDAVGTTVKFKRRGTFPR